ncbi:MAG: tripartite tricarboxylate transporter substrate binding protein, partial [Spirochaetales bacterium]|nr:tripartite tricarboxylate transporter substrate binding protein [Spirochaetales bacterium]
MRKIIVLALTALLLLSSVFAQGQAEANSTYPEKGITMIVPYGAGGTTDVSGRKFAELLSKELGVIVTVVNQAGASGSIGCQAA